MPFADAAALGIMEAGAAEVGGAAIGAEVAGGAIAGETLAGGAAADTLYGMTAAEFAAGVTTGAEASLWGAGAGGVADAGSFLPGAAETVGAGPSVASAATPTTTGTLAQETLSPAATDTVMDGAVDTGSGASGDATTAAEKSMVEGSKPTPGIIDSAVQWADKHPLPATLLGTQIAGAVGGVGKAALEKEIQQRNIQARKDLLTQQTEEQLRLSRAGTLPNAVNVKSKPGPLKRPDGTLVYGPGGIINSTIGR